MDGRRKRTRIDANVDESLPAGPLTAAGAGDHSLRPVRRSIDGVGVLQPGFDRIVIVSSAPVGVLKSRLPLQMLKSCEP